jgi:hypothetical protein
MDATWTMESTPTRIVRWKNNIVYHFHADRTSKEDRLQFIRRQWWQRNYATWPEVYTPETVPSEFVEKYTNRTDKNIKWAYHTLFWEDKVVENKFIEVREYWLVNHLAYLETEEEKESEKLLAKKLFQVLTADYYKRLELLENKRVTVLYKSPSDSTCQLVWV